MEPDFAVECLKNVIDSGLDPGAIAQNKGNSENVKAAVLSIVPHSYGDHEKCGKWCGFIKSPSIHKHKYLRYGKGLTNPSLGEDLDKFFFQLAECGENWPFSVSHGVTKPYIIS